MKKAQVIWSNTALHDMETIYDFLVEKSQPAAQRIIETILGRAKQLESFPESGVKQETVKPAIKEYRYLIEGDYKILYSYQAEIQRVYIATIFDTRYNPEKMKV